MRGNFIIEGQYDPRSIVVLVVDDDPDDLQLVFRAMQSVGITKCFVSRTGEAALTWLESNECNVVVFEHNLSGMNGLQLLNLVRRAHPEMKLIATARTKDIKLAVSLMKQGASDFIAKDDFFSSSIGRAVQGAARDLSIETELRSAEAMSVPQGGFDTANVEAAWLLKMFRNRYGYKIPSPASREDELRRWEDIVATFKDYVETSLRMFPELVVRSEDALVRMIVERGLSPRDIVNLYYLAVVSVRESNRGDGSRPRVNPGVLLSRILVRVVEEYQRMYSQQEYMAA
jgi:ActR/RegA family two-component response regulator